MLVDRKNRFFVAKYGMNFFNNFRKSPSFEEVKFARMVLRSIAE